MTGKPGANADDPAADQPSLMEKKSPMRRQFTNRKDQPRLSPEQAARQGQVVSAALRALPAGAAMTYLNTDQAGLGRPLDLAIESAAGLAAVEAALALRAANRG
jgi:hypothetical protein